MPNTGRFTVNTFEGLRFHVWDEKYEDEYLVDLSVKPHGQCGCKEFRFQVEIHKKRTTCCHIDHLIQYLQDLKKPLKKIRPPSFKDVSDETPF